MLFSLVFCAGSNDPGEDPSQGEDPLGEGFDHDGHGFASTMTDDPPGEGSTTNDHKVKTLLAKTFLPSQD